MSFDDQIKSIMLSDAPVVAGSGPRSGMFSPKVSEWDDTVVAAATKYGVDPNLVRGVMNQESRGNPGAVSPKGALGLMQLMPRTAASLGVDPSDPAQNIEGGVKLLGMLQAKYGEIPKALAAYNWGEPGLDRAIAKHGDAWGDHLPAETRDYIDKIGNTIPISGDFDAIVASIYGLPYTPPEAQPADIQDQPATEEPAPITESPIGGANYPTRQFAPTDVARAPISSMVPAEELARKERLVGESESPFESFLQEFESAMTYQKQPEARVQGRYEENPIASTIGAATGMLAPALAGGTGIAKAPMEVPQIAGLVARHGKVGKVAYDALTRMATTSGDYVIRNREELTSSDPVVRQKALTGLAAGAAASGASVAPEMLKSGWWQPILQGLTAGATNVAAQKMTGEDPLTASAATNTIFQTLMGGVFGLGSVRGAPRVLPGAESGAEAPKVDATGAQKAPEGQVPQTEQAAPALPWTERVQKRLGDIGRRIGLLPQRKEVAPENLLPFRPKEEVAPAPTPKPAPAAVEATPKVKIPAGEEPITAQGEPAPLTVTRDVPEQPIIDMNAVNPETGYTARAHKFFEDLPESEYAKIADPQTEIRLEDYHPDVQKAITDIRMSQIPDYEGLVDPREQPDLSRFAPDIANHLVEERVANSDAMLRHEHSQQAEGAKLEVERLKAIVAYLTAGKKVMFNRSGNVDRSGYIKFHPKDIVEVFGKNESKKGNENYVFKYGDANAERADTQLQELQSLRPDLFPPDMHATDFVSWIINDVNPLITKKGLKELAKTGDYKEAYYGNESAKVREAELKRLEEQRAANQHNEEPWNAPQDEGVVTNGEEMQGRPQGEVKFSDETGTMAGFEDTRKPWEIELARREAERKTTQREAPLEGTMFDQNEMEARATEQGNMFGTSAAASKGRYASREAPGEEAPPRRPASDAAKDGELPSAVEFPELVEMAKNLNSGVVPKIKNKLRIAGATGIARGKEIELLAGLSKDPEQAAKTLSHEIGHVADFVPDSDIKRGNLLGRIASLKKHMARFMAGFPGGKGYPTDAEIANLKARAKESGEVVREEVVDDVIKKETDYTPQEVKDIWNKYEQDQIDPKLKDYVMRLSDAEKKRIVVQAMRGIVDPSLPKKTTETVVGKKTVRRVIENDKSTAQKFKELLDDEIRNRQLLDNRVVKKELADLGQIWKPFNPKADDSYTKYRMRPEELYADAFSVLLNEPALLKEKAPNFYRGFFAYLERKPEFKADFDAIQERVGKGSDAVQEKRLGTTFENYDRVEQQHREKIKADEEAANKRKTGILKSLYRRFVEKGDIIESAVNAAKKAGIIVPDEVNPFLHFRQQKYRAGREEAYLRGAAEAEKKAFIKDDVDWNSRDVRKYLGAYLQNIRNAGELKEKFGSGGIQGKYAEEQLAYIEKKLGPEKSAKIKAAADDYFKTRQEEISPMLLGEDAMSPYSDTFSKELAEKIKNNREYTRREVEKNFTEGAGGDGRGSLLNIKSVVGTLKGIGNPFIETVVYDLGLLRAKMKSDFVRSTVEFFDQFQGRESIVGAIKVKPTETRNTAMGKQFVEAGGDMETFYFLKNGKPQAYDVSKDLADILHSNIDNADGMLAWLRRFGDIQRQVFVKFSLPFILRNPIRDIKGSMMNLPEYGVNPIPLLKYTFKALPEVWHYLKTGEMSADLKAAYKEGAIPVQRQWSKEVDFEKAENQDALSRVQSTFSQNKDKVGYKNWLDKAWNGTIDPLFEFIGQFEEKSRKLADYKFLKEQHPEISPMARAQKIRASSGTPDVFAGGTDKKITNQLWLFSNANIQGQRAAWQAMKTDPRRYLAKFALYDLAPKAIIAAIGFGGAKWAAENLGLDEKAAKWLEDAYARIPTIDKARYTPIPLPIRTESGKQVYLRIPTDYTGQLIGSMAYQMMSIGKPKGVQNLAKEAFSASPIGDAAVQPVLDLAMGWSDYLKHGNIYDSWSGNMVLPKDIEGSSFKNQIGPLAKWSYDQIGGSIVYRIPDEQFKDQDWPQKILGLPVAGPAFNAMFKISDAGLRENMKDERFRIQQEKKDKSIDVKGLINESLKNETPDRATARRLWKQAKTELGYDQNFGRFWSRYRDLALKQLPETLVAEISKATSVEEREVAVETYLNNVGMTGREREKEKRVLMKKSRLFRKVFEEQTQE